ncbi:3-oxoacyl-ACP reductase family protein [Caulobacter sp. 1776]|uniref:SDR family NAD(P)-dependent oxidoreductase n=1 Tax=Caulobacter sp. 1776 TaxID=3156420 RepID=UPI0033990E16
MGQLTGKIAIVTGSDSGIGQGIAEELAREGADVAITYLHDQAGAAETKQKVEACGRRAFVTRLDQVDEASVSALFDGVVEALGRPDILINNAGATEIKQAPFAQTPTEDFDRMIKVDLYGPFFCSREFVRRRASGGKIINITSVHEVTPSPKYTAYNAAKGGLLSFTRGLALELAPQKITVNAIAPGLTRAPPTLERIESPEGQARIKENIPLQRAGEPREVGRLAVYLASEDADYITGQSFTIDGGLETNWGQGA